MTRVVIIVIIIKLVMKKKCSQFLKISYQIFKIERVWFGDYYNYIIYYKLWVNK